MASKSKIPPERLNAALEVRDSRKDWIGFDHGFGKSRKSVRYRNKMPEIRNDDGSYRPPSAAFERAEATRQITVRIGNASPPVVARHLIRRPMRRHTGASALSTSGQSGHSPSANSLAPLAVSSHASAGKCSRLGVIEIPVTTARLFDAHSPFTPRSIVLHYLLRSTAEGHRRKLGSSRTAMH